MSDKITEITRSVARTLSVEAEKALKEVADRHGLQVTVGGGTYGDGMFKPKVEFKTANADEAEFTVWADLYGLNASDFGRSFISKGHVFEVAGVAPRSRVRPIICVKQGTGQRYKFPADTVRARLAENPR